MRISDWSSDVCSSDLLGGDIACMGTRFIATPESGVVEGHRAMIPTVSADDIVASAAMNGVPAHWMRQSIEAVGLDPRTLPNIRSDMPEEIGRASCRERVCKYG